MKLSCLFVSKCMRPSHCELLQFPQHARFYDQSPQLADSENLSSITKGHFSPVLSSTLQETFHKMFGNNSKLTEVQAELLPPLFDINLGHCNEDIQQSETETSCRRSKNPIVDILIQGRTGSGKTMMFLLKVLQVLENNEQSASGKCFTLNCLL